MLQDFLIKNSQINYEYSQKCYFILLFIIHFWKIHHKWILRALMPFTPINAKNLNFQKRLANISRKTSNNNKFSKICIIFVEKILQTHFKNCLKLYFSFFENFWNLHHPGALFLQTIYVQPPIVKHDPPKKFLQALLLMSVKTCTSLEKSGII